FGNKNDQADLTEYNKIKVYTDDDRRIHIGDIILKDKGELDLLIIVKGKDAENLRKQVDKIKSKKTLKLAFEEWEKIDGEKVLVLKKIDINSDDPRYIYAVKRAIIDFDTETEKANKNSHTNKSSNSSQYSNSETYEITKTNYVDKGIKISYPQITDLSDTNKQKKINDLIKNEGLKVLDYYKNVDEEVSLDINYDIKWKGPNLLSIQYSGIANIKGAAYPNNMFYTTNIDINKGNKLKLTDIININEIFVTKFKEGKYVAWDIELNSANNLIKNDINSYDFVKEFKYADTMGEENTAYSFSYFTKDSLGISVGVPHAIGDHAEFEIEYQDIKDNIKAESETWKDFSNLLSL
ncbi:DUF4163 domain-containing protein, partial [Patescibacteria group bacterium]|nr:DUF4163 domain-containing protein [Patescibacteria group bacterium]